MRWHQFVFFVAAAVFAGCGRPTPPDPRLQAPQELAGAAKKSERKNLFVNPSARKAFESLGVSLAASDPADGNAVRDASAWRRLDRRHRYDGVMLAGDPAEFGPLLTHLAGAPDFRLAHVDNWGVLFARGGGGKFVPPDLGAIAKSFPEPGARSVYLARTATMLDAAGLAVPAREFADAAIAASPGIPDGYVAAAIIALRHRRHAEAVENAERALKISPDHRAALEVEVQTLVALKATDAAWRVARRLKAAVPADDLNALFLHARVANAARAYADEQASLEALVAAAEKRGLPSTDYRIYLGQCYAKQGLARPALEQFEILSRAKDLTEQQRADVATALQSIRNRAGALSN